MGLSDFFLRPKPEDVVREHGPRVLALLRRLFGSSDVVDDVFQNVFIEVLRSLPRFEGRARLSTWIHRVALNVAYQEMRQQHGRTRLVALDGDDGEDPSALAAAAAAGDGGDGRDVHAEVERRQAARRLHRALATLPPKQRLAVALHDLEGLTLREIAEHLGIPLQTVASQVRAGRAALAEAVADLATPKQRLQLLQQQRASSKRDARQPAAEQQQPAAEESGDEEVSS